MCIRAWLLSCTGHFKDQAQRGPTRYMRTCPHILQRKHWEKVSSQQCCTETVTVSSGALYICVRGSHLDPNPGVSGWDGSKGGAKEEMDELLDQLLGVDNITHSLPD